MDSSSATPGGTPRTITKKELVARIAERTNQTKVVAKDIIQLFLDEIIRELGNGNRLEFREFGVFEIKERRNPGGEEREEEREPGACPAHDDAPAEGAGHVLAVLAGHDGPPGVELAIRDGLVADRAEADFHGGLGSLRTGMSTRGEGVKHIY